MKIEMSQVDLADAVALWLAANASAASGQTFAIEWRIAMSGPRARSVTCAVTTPSPTSHHPHVDRAGAYARASAIAAGHSVECAEFGTDAACQGPTS
jgi:hypothetical protein